MCNCLHFRQSCTCDLSGTALVCIDGIDINISYIILKRVIWRFQIYNLFLEIFKFREYKSNNEFREVLKCFRKTAKFEFFAKQITRFKMI